MVTQEVYIALFVAVVLGIVVIAFLLLTVQRLRRRKTQLEAELKGGSPRLVADRAFNRLGMARREIAILAQQGTDVGRARELIAQSQSAFDLGQFDRSYELAQSAHESMVSARQGHPLTSGPAASPTTPPALSRPLPTGSGAGAPPAAASPPTSASPRLPPNRAESQFEMRWLASDLESAQRTHPSDPGTIAAAGFQASAQSAFDAEQYTDALRLALKGRRGLGGTVETVAPPPSARGTGGPGIATDPATDPIDAGAAADRAAGAARCPRCGYPMSTDDAFCRGCGVPSSPMTCSRCGTPRTSGDTFCGRCGERFS